MKRIRIVLAAALTFVTICIFKGCNWQDDIPENYYVKAGDSGAMDIDSSGIIHILYTVAAVVESGSGKSGIFYAKGTPESGWTQERVFEEVGTIENLGIMANGIIIALLRQERKVFLLKKSTSGVWTKEPFYDNEAGPGGGIAFDNAGGIHICHSYYLTDTLGFDNLRPLYSYKAPGSGNFITTPISLGTGWVDVNYGKKTSIAVDSAGKAHMLIGREGQIIPYHIPKLYYASAEASGGTVNSGAEVSNSATQSVDNSIAISPDGKIHAAYLGYQNPAGRLKYLSSSDGGANWSSVITVDDTENSGYGVVLKTDSLGGLHAAYLVVTDSTGTTIPKIKYAYRPDPASSWETEEIDEKAYPAVSLVIGSQGRPVLIYGKDTGEGEYASYRELKVACKNSAGNWELATLRDTSLNY